MRHGLLAMFALVAVVATSACSTTPVGLTYDPDKAATAPIQQGKPSVEVMTVSDYRKHDPNWLGAIRGGYGNPLKTLETPVPVKEVVKTAFADGLKARNLLASNSRHAMDLKVVQFDCNQYIRREAHAKVDVSIIERASGRSVYSRQYESDKVSGSLMSMDVGIFASVDDLKVVANDALQDVVDRALDDPQLRAALN